MLILASAERTTKVRLIRPHPGTVKRNESNETRDFVKRLSDKAQRNPYAQDPSSRPWQPRVNFGIGPPNGLSDLESTKRHVCFNASKKVTGKRLHAVPGREQTVE
jgi:hypothetical protein